MWFYWVTTFCLEIKIVASWVSVELSHWLHEIFFGIKLFVIVLGLVLYSFEECGYYGVVLVDISIV
jgi:hypothetical protein